VPVKEQKKWPTLVIKHAGRKARKVECYLNPAGYSSITVYYHCSKYVVARGAHAHLIKQRAEQIAISYELKRSRVERHRIIWSEQHEN